MSLDDKLKKFDKEKEPQLEFDRENISASISYYVDETQPEGPILEAAVKDWTPEHLESLASLIAPMAQKDFFYAVLSRLKTDFYASGRHDEFLQFMIMIEQQKEEMETNDVVRPYITPLDLSRGK